MNSQDERYLRLKEIDLPILHKVKIEFMEFGLSIDTEYLGASLFHHAAFFGELDLCKELYEAGANVDLKDYYGNLPLHVAYEMKHYHICDFILSTKTELRRIRQRFIDGGGKLLNEEELETEIQDRRGREE